MTSIRPRTHRSARGGASIAAVPAWADQTVPSAIVTSARRRGGAGRRPRPGRGIGLLFATPMAIVVGVFFVVPLALMIWMSLNRWPLLGSSRPDGLANYKALLEEIAQDAQYTVAPVNDAEIPF